MKKFLFDCGSRDATASAGILALRVMIGLMMLIGHGIPKMQNFSALKDKFDFPGVFPLNLMSPPINLMACIGAEVGASILIILGLATRPAAFLLGFTMVVASFGVRGADPWFVNPPDVLVAKELGLLYLIPMIAIILSGAGLFSLDASILKKQRRRW